MNFTPTHIHSKLDSDLLYLHEQMPPSKWYALPSFGSAASWLGMHHSLRRGQGELDYLNREFLNQRLEWEEYRNRVLKASELHYGHLHGHHRTFARTSSRGRRALFPQIPPMRTKISAWI